MLTIIRKIIFHLVAIALRAWQQELISRLNLEAQTGKEVNNVETETKTSEKSE